MDHPPLISHGSRASGRSWRIWVDTGGTFTDCLAIDPGGGEHRTKVLSTGRVRARLVEVGDRGATRRIEPFWTGLPGAIAGMTAESISTPSDRSLVTAFDAGTRLLRLDRPLAAAAGETIELSADEEAPILAARLLTGTPAGSPLPAVDMRLATTRGTNALLERAGGPVAFFVTRGFADLLRIGNQQRPDLFALAVRGRDPLHAAVVEVNERTANDGAVLEPLDLEGLDRAARDVLTRGVSVAAVAFLHSWVNPEHESRAAARLRELGFTHVSASAALSPTIGMVPRAETAVADAYLAPVIDRYLTRVRDGLGWPARSADGRGGAFPPAASPLAERAGHPGATLHVLTSAGGLVRADAFSPKDSLLSGPAGGVIGAARAARRSGFSKVIAFDMGGTSTDVARLDAAAGGAGGFDYTFEHEVGGITIAAPALDIRSVAAGGGSICRCERGELRVGPASAGAAPGPACYGAGGPLTITDVNLLLGRVDAGRFRVPLSPAAAEDRAEEARRAYIDQTGRDVALPDLLAAFVDLANERMAGAIREVSVREGYDPRGYALVAFGGAGGQHACAIAERLGVETVLVPRDAGLLSALGLGHARAERFAQRQVLAPLASLGSGLAEIVRALEDDAARAVAADGAAGSAGIEISRRILNLRLAGQETTLAVEYRDGLDLQAEFARRYAAVYGHAPGPRAVEVESVRVVARSAAADEPPPGEQRGGPVDGPALIAEEHCTIVVPAGWRAEADAAGAVVLGRIHADGSPSASTLPPAASGLSRGELLINRLGAIAREMGEALRRTAVSVNVKERLDFSCAVLDADGELIANAPHVPVHLGALGLCVRAVRGVMELRPGDVVLTNHPAFGGSHLPDLTVITPVFSAAGALVAHVASRAHHAEIGGIAPGSMPARATRLDEEGVVIPPMRLLDAGTARWDDVRAILTAGPHPSRAVEDNLADLRAAVAANRHGADAIAALAEGAGAPAVRDAMEELKDRAARRLSEALGRIPAGAYEAAELLDDGSPLRVRIGVVHGRSTTLESRATIDFTGSAGVHPGNLNATRAIVTSAVMYVLRLLVREDLPLNEGLMRGVELRIPSGILDAFGTAQSGAVSPSVGAASYSALSTQRSALHRPAVAAGNVETSQRLVDTLLKALQLAACSQGTMNNVLFGNERFGYYETVCGGCGAGPGFNGASAVHSHMTNTRITDPEVLERRFPVRLERFAVRRGSGGGGRWRGGDGVVREITFLEPVTLSVLAQHRVVAPYGMAGGSPGAPGAQRIVRAGGEVVALGGVDDCQLAAGDRLILETPGGGGWE